MTIAIRRQALAIALFAALALALASAVTATGLNPAGSPAQATECGPEGDPCHMKPPPEEEG